MMQQLLKELRKLDSFPRLVIDLYDSGVTPIKHTGPADILSWSKDSVGSWSKIGQSISPGRVDKLNYLLLPSHGEDMMYRPAVEKLTICRSFLEYVKSNRTCFDKC